MRFHYKKISNKIDNSNLFKCNNTLTVRMFPGDPLGSPDEFISCWDLSGI